MERSAKSKTHTQTKNGIPVANPLEPWALESDNLNLLNLSGRKNVLRKLLRIPYRRLKAGFSVC